MVTKTGTMNRRLPTLAKPAKRRPAATPAGKINLNVLKKGIIRKKGYSDIG